MTKAQLAEVVAQVEKLARLPEDNYYQELLSKWRSVRRFLPTLLRTIQFKSNKAAQPQIDALAFLQSLEGKRNPKMENAPLQTVPKNWRAWVVKKDGMIDRKAYTFCILEQLVEGLRCRDLFVSPSERWSNPSAKLLQGQAWEGARSHVCRALNLNQAPQPELSRLKEQLGALGLVVNAIVLWNTYYMDAALNHLRSEQMVINAEDVARLSPLGYEHINMLGRYRFYLSEDLKNGAMRPLRNPNQFEALDDWGY